MQFYHVQKIFLLEKIIVKSSLIKPLQICARASFCVHCTHLGNPRFTYFRRQISVTNYRIRNVLAANLMIHYTCILHNSINSILAWTMANRLPADDLEEVTRDVSRVYVQAMYSVVAIVVECDARNREKSTLLLQ